MTIYQDLNDTLTKLEHKLLAGSMDVLAPKTPGPTPAMRDAASPVPFVDDSGKPIVDAKGQPLLRPKGTEKGYDLFLDGKITGSDQ